MAAIELNPSFQHKRKTSITLQKNRWDIPFLPLLVLVIFMVHLYLLDIHFKHNICHKQVERFLRTTTTLYSTNPGTNVAYGPSTLETVDYETIDGQQE